MQMENEGIKIIAISKRAKNRVREHGEIMQVLAKNSNRILVKSMNKTWNNNTEHWLGWFHESDIANQWSENVGATS